MSNCRAGVWRRHGRPCQTRHRSLSVRPRRSARWWGTDAVSYTAIVTGPHRRPLDLIQPKSVEFPHPGISPGNAARTGPLLTNVWSVASRIRVEQKSLSGRGRDTTVRRNPPDRFGGGVPHIVEDLVESDCTVVTSATSSWPSFAGGSAREIDNRLRSAGIRSGSLDENRPGQIKVLAERDS